MCWGCDSNSFASPICDDSKDQPSEEMFHWNLWQQTSSEPLVCCHRFQLRWFLECLASLRFCVEGQFRQVCLLAAPRNSAIFSDPNWSWPKALASQGTTTMNPRSAVNQQPGSGWDFSTKFNRITAIATCNRKAHLVVFPVVSAMGVCFYWMLEATFASESSPGSFCCFHHWWWMVDEDDHPWRMISASERRTYYDPPWCCCCCSTQSLICKPFSKGHSSSAVNFIFVTAAGGLLMHGEEEEEPIH